MDYGHKKGAGKTFQPRQTLSGFIHALQYTHDHGTIAKLENVECVVSLYNHLTKSQGFARKDTRSKNLA